jgi:phosphoglucosamine mutase
MASEGPLSLLVNEIPSYPIIRGNLVGDRKALQGLGPKLGELRPQYLSTADGFRLAFDGGWLLIRPSGTEPKVRLTAEARSQEHASELYETGVRIVEGCLKEAL